MSDRFRWLGAAIVLCTAVLAANTSAPLDPSRQPQVFRSAVNYVRVDVYPRKNGRIVAGLTAPDFDVFEDGKRQTIDALQFYRTDPSVWSADPERPSPPREVSELAADPANRVFVVYLDPSHVSAAGAHRSDAPLVTFLGRAIAPNDLIGVLSPLEHAKDLKLGRGLNDIADALAHNWGENTSLLLSSADEAFVQCYGDRTAPDGELTQTVATLLGERRREDLVLSRLEELVDYLRPLRQERKYVLLLTDGWRLFRPNEALAAMATVPAPPSLRRPESPMTRPSTVTDACNGELLRLAAIDDDSRLRDLMALANRSNVTFYTIGPSATEAADPFAPVAANGQTPAKSVMLAQWNKLRVRQQSLRTLATNTDGLAVLDADLSTGLQRISDDLTGYYVLGYYSTNKRLDGKFRKIDVKTRVSGVSLVSRRGYIGPTAADVSSRPAPPPADGRDIEEMKDLNAALASLSRLDAPPDVFLSAQRSGDADVIVVAEIPSDVAETAWSAGGHVAITVTTPSSGERLGEAIALMAPGTRSVSIRLPRIATTSALVAHVTITNPIDGGKSVAGVADVPPADAALLFAPLVFRADAASASALRPAAEPLFRRTERLHVEWQAFEKLETYVVRLLTRVGQPLPVPVAVSERNTEGHQIIAADVSLGPLGAGDYALEITATLGQARARRVTAIRVTR